MIEISVIMSTQNTKEAFLRQAVESILTQSFADFEFIVVDDGSEDADGAIVQSYCDPRIKVLRNAANKGLPYSLNRGIDAAKGKYIVRMDSDDIALPDRLEKQLAFMEQHPEIDIAGGLAWRFGSKNGLMEFCDVTHDTAMYLYIKNRLVHPGVIMRKSFLDAHGLRYNEQFLRSQDYELWSRAMRCGTVAVMPSVVLKYRCHDQQASSAHEDEQKAFSIRIYQKTLMNLGIAPADGQCALHYALANAKQAESPTALISWADTLIRHYNESEKKDKAVFMREVNYRLILNLLRHLLSGNYRIDREVAAALFSIKRLKDFVSQYSMYRRTMRKMLRINQSVINTYCK